MHNSLFIKDIIKRSNSLEMVKKRRDPHRNVFFEETKLNKYETKIINCNINVAVDSRANKTIGNDLKDFLKHMGIKYINVTDKSYPIEMQPRRVELSVIDDVTPIDTTPNVQNINFVLYNEFAPRDYSIKVDYTKITISCGGIEGAWAAIIDLENKMKLRRAPILKICEYNKTARWDHQISQGPWNANYSVPDFDEEYLSEDTFKTYAHYGVREMMIYGDILVYSNSGIIPELKYNDYKESIRKLKEASEKAIKYGVRFLYVPIMPKLLPDHPVFVNHPEIMGGGLDLGNGKEAHFLCSSSKLVQHWLFDVFQNLYSEVPLLAGATLLVSYETFYHCKMWEGVRDNNIICPHCNDLSFEESAKNIIMPAYNGIRNVNKDAVINVWEYTYFGNRPDLYNILPKDINIFYTIEKDTMAVKDGYVKSIWDYSIDFTGPGTDMLRLKNLAKKNGQGLFVKTETGIGLETLQYPYVSALYQLADKWEKVRSVTPNGVHQSWLFFGMFGSRAEELAYWACYGTESKDDYLKNMAIRDFGEENTDRVLTAWKYMSEAVRHLPSLQCPFYYQGPLFLGPCHPLLPKGKIPEIFNAKLFYMMETEESFSKKNIEDTDVILCINKLTNLKDYSVFPFNKDFQNWDIFINEYNSAMQLSFKAYKLFKDMQVNPNLIENLTDEKNLCEIFYRTMRACKNTFSYLVARDIKKCDYSSILKDELDNSKNAIHIYSEAPYLDLKERIDGYYSSSVEMIEEKIRIIEDLLSK